VRVADHGTHAWEGGDFLRGTLGVAAGDYDPGVGIFAMNAANGGAGVLVGSGRYSAGVKNNDLRLSRLAGAL
jgi:hypothetical protein